MGLTRPISIEKINQGGISDSIYAGAKYSVAQLVGCDIHSKPGLTTVRQKLAKDSAAVITQFCKVGLETSTGDIYFFSSTSGKIWKVGSPYTLAHTTTPNIGAAGCLGAFEYAGYLYWCTEDRGHRIPVNSTALADWSTYAQEDVLELDKDQDTLGSTGDVYTNTTAIAEGATHRQTFVPFSDVLSAIGVHVTAKGTGNWTVAVHDSSNNLLTSKAIAIGDMSTGWVIFEFSTTVPIVQGSSYHIHIYSSVADGTTTTTTSEDLEDGYIKIYRTSDSEFHPMIEHFGVLYIGDRNFVHQVEKSSHSTGANTGGVHTFTREALDIEKPLRVKCLGKAPLDLLIGTITSSTLSESQLIKWNTYSESFTSSDPIPEVGINAFIPVDNRIFVHAGLGGSIYLYDGYQLQSYKKIQGDYSPTATATVHPNAVGMLSGISLFGLSNGTGDPAQQGVYALGHYSRDYPFVYDLSYPISERSGTDSVLTGLEVGAIVVSGFDLYVSWKHGSNYGVDKLDYSKKFENAYIASRVIWIDRSEQQNFAKFVASYKTNPTDTYLYLNHDINYQGSWTNLSTLKNDTDRKIWITDEELQVGNTLQIQIGFVANGNSAPDFETLGIYLSQ